MFKKMISNAKKMLSGDLFDDLELDNFVAKHHDARNDAQLNEFVKGHRPSSEAEELALREKFWKNKFRQKANRHA